MMHWPSFALGAVVVSPLALLVLPFLVALAVRPRRIFALLGCLSALPLLTVPPGPGLVGGVAVFALMVRGVAVSGQQQQMARLALLWLPVAVLQVPTSVQVWPNAVWLLATAVTAGLAVAAALDARMRWPLALLLVALPFAPFGDALLQPANIVAELPLPQIAARWHFTGSGEVDTAALAGIWFIADRVARCLLFVGLLLGWIAARRSQSSLRSLATLFLLVALLMLVGQSVAAAHLPGRAPGFPGVSVEEQGWNAAGLALAVARIGSLLLLLRVDLPARTVQLDRWAGMAACVTLAFLALNAPAVAGPNWLADPLPLGLVALLVAAFVRTHGNSRLANLAAGLVQVAAAASLAGGAWAGWATATYLAP